MSSPLSFSGDEIIGDILQALPEASDILLSHGVSCASCHVNAYETLKDGILGHGFPEETLHDILSDLNEAASDLGLHKTALDKKPVTLSEKAAEKITQFQESQQKKGYGFRVEVTVEGTDEPSYFLDLEEKAGPDDQIVCSHNIKLFLDPDSYRFLQNKTIDFVENEEDAGFKIY